MHKFESYVVLIEDRQAAGIEERTEQTKVALFELLKANHFGIDDILLDFQYVPYLGAINFKCTEQVANFLRAQTTYVEGCVKVETREQATHTLYAGMQLVLTDAADVLNVSLEYFACLLDQEKIPFTLVGEDRRVRFEDLLTYRVQREAERQTALDELTAQAQELDMGYEAR